MYEIEACGLLTPADVANHDWCSHNNGEIPTLGLVIAPCHTNET